MKTKSITKKMFQIFIVFTLTVFAIILVSTSLFLPSYYKTKTLNDLKTNLSSLDQESITEQEVLTILNEVTLSQGGSISYLDDEGNLLNAGKKRQNSFLDYPTDQNVFEGIFTNKNGKDIFVKGVRIDDGFIVYELSISELDKSINIINEFLLYIFILSLVIGVGFAYFISKAITSPIIKLNNKTIQMQKMQPIPLEVVDAKDEISQLSNSVVLMYENLLSNIQSLETEVQKEKAIEKMKKQFLAQATHELKTPIAIIQGYSELVSEGIYEDEIEQQEFLSNINKETEKLNLLMNDILDYSKIESGFFNIKKEETFINPWLNQIVTNFNKIMPNEIAFIVDNKVGDLCTSLDKVRVEQVINNLLLNAIEHAEGLITFNAYNLEGRLVLEVINEGPKINEDDLPFIFESFYKNKHKNKGSGLGLAIVKGIVELHNGQYRVENLDLGVKFTIII